jgi:hypothetical protein
MENVNVLQSYFFCLTENDEKEERKKFYSYLYSFALLNGYYDNIYMICDKTAYDLFIRFIPYKGVTIVDDAEVLNGNYLKTKYNIINTLSTPLICVDGNVFLFDHIIKDFLESKKDIIIQNYENNANRQDSIFKLKQFKKFTNILNVNPKEIVNTNILGFKNETDKNKLINLINEYYNIIDTLKFPIKNKLAYDFQKYIEGKFVKHILTKNGFTITDNGFYDDKYTKIDFKNNLNQEILDYLIINIHKRQFDFTFNLYKYEYFYKIRTDKNEVIEI